VNVAGQIGSAIANTQFVSEELKRTHAFIARYELDVTVVENDLHHQMRLLEEEAGTHIFAQALRRYKRVNAILILLATVVLLITGGVVGINKLKPELGLVDQLYSSIFDHFIPFITIVSVLFGGILLLTLWRQAMARSLHGKTYARAWHAIAEAIHTRQS